MLWNHARLLLGLLPFVTALALQEASGGGEGDDGGYEDGEDQNKRQRGSDGSEEGDEEEEHAFKAPQSEEELQRMIRRRIQRAETKAAEKAEAKLREELEREDAKKKDDVRKLLELEQKRTADLEAEVKRLQAGSLREKAAAKFNLPDDLAELLKGETEEELTAHAERLSKLVGKSGDGEEGEEKRRREDVENDLGTPGSKKRTNRTPVQPFRIGSSVKTVKIPGA